VSDEARLEQFKPGWDKLGQVRSGYFRLW